MKKFFKEMPKSDKTMFLVCVLVSLIIGAMLGGVGYAFHVPLWQCLLVGAFLPVLVPSIHLFYLVVLYIKSKKYGTPRESMSDFAVPTEKPVKQSQVIDAIAGLIMGVALGDMASRNE